MITHISFDLWLTLICSNPLFRKKRAEFIAETYNPENRDASEIERFIKERDKVFDRYNEMNGTKLPAEEMYRQVLGKIKGNDCRATSENAGRLMKVSNELFMEYSPHLLNNHIPHILEELKSRGVTLSIGSNTGFVEGDVLRKALKKLNILHYFSFLVFSDEIKTSKPASSFFRHIANQANLPQSRILHVGDNPKTDYQGAISFGFNALLITNPNYSIDDIRIQL
ncbi:MAG: HAD family hydrolase [Tannerella sp.]|jgi:putative hydrolase of the HAD superfamily|nr:HAD family hydrolase [Tannerella sp.]